MKVHETTEADRIAAIKEKIIDLMCYDDPETWREAAKLMYEWFNNEAYWRLIEEHRCPFCGEYLAYTPDAGRINCANCDFYQDMV